MFCKRKYFDFHFKINISNCSYTHKNIHIENNLMRRNDSDFVIPTENLCVFIAL